MTQQIDVSVVIAVLKDQIAEQAGEIAVLKATINAMSKDSDEVE